MTSEWNQVKLSGRDFVLPGPPGCMWICSGELGRRRREPHRAEQDRMERANEPSRQLESCKEKLQLRRPFSSYNLFSFITVNSVLANVNRSGQIYVREGYCANEWPPSLALPGTAHALSQPLLSTFSITITAETSLSSCNLWPGGALFRR